MPELPEVEIVRRGLEPALAGATVVRLEVRRPDLRFPFPDGFSRRVEGQQIIGVDRRAKYLLIRLSSGESLIVHLGMSGRLTVDLGQGGGETLGRYVYDSGALPQHDHVVMTLSTGARVTYNDPRRFGFMLLAQTAALGGHPLFEKLGVEPLSGALTPAYLAGKAQGRRVDLKAFLLDQHVVAGLGNIYVAEALFRAGLSPRRSAATLAKADGQATARAHALVGEVQAVLRAAIEAGGSSLRDYRHADGSSGSFQEAFSVYDREGLTCVRPECRGTVRRLVQAQRSTFYCATCQR